MRRIIMMCLLLGLPGYAMAAQSDCRAAIKTPFGLVALYDADAMNWLENSNQFGKLCEKEALSAACAARVLAPQTRMIELRETPGGKPAGSIMVVYAPANGLSAAYISPLSHVQYFKPDDYDPDWGDVHFHQTFIAREGDWFRLALPGGEFGWAERKGANVKYLEKGDYVSLSTHAYMVLEVRAKTLLIRDEQEGEACSSGGDRFVLKPYEPRELSLYPIYDEGCHLRLRYTYPGAC
ncbi:MAG: hypothetical protein WDO70_03020 [Alphaproteobacteria bacterium]